MPFIWDDLDYMLIDETEKYDRSCFVIVRKIFVTPNTSTNKQEINVRKFNEEILNKYFRKYGDIETIELLKPKEQDADKTTKSEAYITFQRDVFAFAAVSDHKIRNLESIKCLYNVQPADTWEQPRQPNSNVERMILDEDVDFVPPIFMLHPDCFEKLFQYLDIVSLMNLLLVCKKFNTLVHERGFNHIKSFKYIHVYDSKKSLAQMRRMLKCVGKHINQVHFSGRHAGKKFHRFFEILGRHVGENIRCAYFKVERLHERDVTAIEAILLNLTSLNIFTGPSEFDLQLFQILCPNLRNLVLNFNAKLIGCNKPWPRLEYFKIHNSDLSSNAICTFLEKNPQMTTLKLFSGREDNILQTAGTHLPNVQKLTIYQRDTLNSVISAEILRHLITLQNLKKLSLFNVKNAEINGILNCLKQFSTLHRIKFVMQDSEDPAISTQIQQPIINLAQKLSHLEKICFYGVTLIESTILEFIRFAKKLKEIHIHECRLKITQKFVMDIVEVLKSSRPQDTTVTIQLFITEYDTVDLKAIQKLDIENYLCVSKNCRQSYHRFR